MSKGRIFSNEKRKKDEHGLAPKPLSNCQRCIISRQSEDARMIVIDKQTVCDLLYLTYENQLITVDNFKKENDCSPSNWTETITLSGYYLKLENSDLDFNQNRLVFYPTWIIESYEQIIEKVGQGIILENFSISTTIIAMQEGDFISLEPDSNNPSDYSHHFFNHKIMQFHALAKRNVTVTPFMNVFISRHDLLLISNEATHVGLCGATVQTGNIASYSYNANIESPAIKIKNEEYFTYRIIGFVEQNIRDGKKVLVKKGLKLDSNETTFLPGSPAETWAVPCPPRWKPIF